MKELDGILAEVKQVLTAKENEINKAGGCTITFVTDAFKKRRKEVSGFELSMAGLNNTEPVNQKNIIEKFAGDARELIGAINNILV